MKKEIDKIKEISTNDEIDLKIIFNLLIKNKFTLGLITAAFFIIFCIYALLQKRVWEGKFVIVVEEQEKGLARAIGGNDQQNFITSLNLLGGTSNLNTQVEILKSPSVLLPIFDFVNNEKKINGEFNEIPFEIWKKNNLNIKLTPRTSILNITYKDSNKEIIIPVLSKISNAYQVYSGKSLKRKLQITKNYLNTQINKYKIKSSQSLKIAQEFALDEDLTLFEINQDDGLPSNVNLEKLRIKSLNKIRNIDKQLEQIKSLGDDYEKFQYIANNLAGIVPSILADLNKIETNLVEARSKYTERDRTIINLLDKRQILLKLLKEKSIANLKALRILEVAKMESVSRPKNVVLKYKELIRTAARDENTLVELENQLRIINLEEAKYKDPWELITEPTLNESPIAPRRKRIGIIGIIIGLISGVFFVSFKENFLKKKLPEDNIT
tara:strand:- start:1288 stop:2607 length:1320 start_codon:yes stop_codon:yes gene_type:complete